MPLLRESPGEQQEEASSLLARAYEVLGQYRQLVGGGGDRQDRSAVEYGRIDVLLLESKVLKKVEQGHLEELTELGQQRRGDPNTSGFEVPIRFDPHARVRGYRVLVGTGLDPAMAQAGGQLVPKPCRLAAGDGL